MNNNEAREKVLALITEKGTATPPEINYVSKIPLVQVYGALKKLMEEDLIEMEQQDNNKMYRLSGKKSSAKSTTEKVKNKPEKDKTAAEEPDEKTTKVQMNTGRDLTKYKFNGQDNLSKGRLALAIVSKAATDRKLTLKAALELFPDEIIPPYGTIRPIKEARALSSNRPRFFIKDDEVVKLKDAIICVSNQWTTERIAKIIAIGKKLKYTIK